MAIELAKIKCPECGATVAVEEGKEQYFCSYCGSKILVTNSNYRTVRMIDDASMRQAEIDREIKLKELEIRERDKKRWRYGCIALLLLGFVMTIIGFNVEGEIGEVVGPSGYFILFGTIIAMMIHSSNNKKD